MPTTRSSSLLAVRSQAMPNADSELLPTQTRRRGPQCDKEVQVCIQASLKKSTTAQLPMYRSCYLMLLSDATVSSGCHGVQPEDTQAAVTLRS